jgi:hypothetical protein
MHVKRTTWSMALIGAALASTGLMGGCSQPDDPKIEDKPVYKPSPNDMEPAPTKGANKEEYGANPRYKKMMEKMEKKSR